MAFANVVVEVPALPTAEVHEAPTEHVVGGVEATPPPADQGSAGEVIHEATAASSSAEMVEGQVSIATTTSESPSSSAGVLQLTSEKRLGRPNKKRSAVAAPQNEAPRAGTTGPSGSAGTLQLTAKKRRGRPKKCGPVAAPQNEALQVGMNVPPSTAERDKSNEPPNLQPPSKKRRGRPKKAPKSAIKPTPMASDSHSHPARLRGRPRKQKPAAAAAPQNVLPTANEQANEDQDASVVMEAVQGLVDAVSLSAQERCDGSADAFPKERHGGDAEANEREADRSSLEARRADETVAPTRHDVTASIRTVSSRGLLGLPMTILGKGLQIETQIGPMAGALPKTGISDRQTRLISFGSFFLQVEVLSPYDFKHFFLYFQKPFSIK